jgi:hypothetical protein
MTFTSHTPSTEEGVMKMHRKIRKVDMGSEEQSKDVDMEQDEDVQYRSGRLERSSGNATVVVVNNSTSDDSDPLFSLSQAFAASGSYKMELKACRKLEKYTYLAQKRRILSEMRQDSKEEDLKVTSVESKH